MNQINYAVDDEFGTQIASGLSTYGAAMRVARRYLSTHDSAPAVMIYEDRTGGESWELTRADVLG